MPAKTAVAAIAAAVLSTVLAACGSSSTPESSTSTSPTVSDAVAWAQSVCERTDELKASIDAIGTSVSVDPGADGSALDQIKAQLAPQVQQVKGDIVDLGGALADVPEGSDPAVTAAAAQMKTDQAAVQTAADGLQSSVDTLQNATGIANTVLAFKDVVTQAGALGSALGTFGSSVKSTVAAGGDAVRSAFADAPGCSAYTTS